MKKVFSKVFLGFLCLCLVVVGFAPITAKASTVHYPNKSDIPVDVQIQALQYGVWSTLFSISIPGDYTDVTYLYDTDIDAIDHVEGPNYRVRIWYDISHSVPKGSKVSIEDYFETGVDYEYLYANHCLVNVYGVDSYRYIRPLATDIRLSSTEYVGFSFSTVRDDYCEEIMIEYEFNVHKAMPLLNNLHGRLQSFFLFGELNIFYEDVGFHIAPPSDDLNSLDEFLLDYILQYKGSMGGFGEVLLTFWQFDFLISAMVFVSVVSVVSYVVFGRKG